MISVDGTEQESEPGREPDQEAEAPDPIDYGPLLAFGGLIVIVVAVGAIGATLLRSVFDNDASPTTTTPRTVTTTAPPRALEPGEVTAAHPTLDAVSRYEQDGSIVLLMIRGEVCGRGEGTLGASGVITNAWMRGTYDYVIGVDLIRSWTQKSIGYLETTVDGLAPGATAEWSVEMTSSRVSAIKCEITSVTAIPAG
jgi:hypothetical protein